MKQYRSLFFIFLFFVSFFFIDLQKSQAATCPQQGDAGTYSDSSTGKCYSKTGLGFNTTDATNTYTCGPVLCLGATGSLPVGNTCIYSDANGKCWTGYGSSGFNPPKCTYNEPAPIPVACPAAMPLTIRVADSNNNGIPNVAVQIHYADAPPANTNGTTISANTDANGNIVINNTLYPGDHFTLTASGPYQFVPDNWAPTSGKIIGGEVDPGTEEMDTNWSCGQQLKNGTVTTPCLFTIATHNLSGTVFVDSNKNGTKDAGENGYKAGSVTVQATGQNIGKTYTTTTSAANGTYTFSNMLADKYNVTITAPNGYQTTSANPINGIDITTADSANNNFGINSTYTITGNVFIDANKNQIKDAGEQNYTGGTTVTSSAGTVTNNPNGTYSITGLIPGTYVVTYTSGLPAGYFMVYPKPVTPPPSFSVTVGTGNCVVDGTTGASCDAQGNIQNLNFAITNSTSWIQTYGFDTRFDNGYQDPIPQAPTCPAYFSNQDSDTTTPGIAFSGDTNSSFGQGQASSTNWVVGGLAYPELYKPAEPYPLFVSYEKLLARTTEASIQPTNLTTLANCKNLTSCTLPAGLANGIYQANGDTTLNGYTFQGNKNYIFLINGTLSIVGNVQVAAGSTAVFAAAKDIVIDQGVGAASNVCPIPAGQIQGIFSADRNFIVNGINNCLTGTDKMLNIEGDIIINASDIGGSFMNNRDLCGDNPKIPSVTLRGRLDFLLNLPTFMMQQSATSQEAAP